MQDLLKKCGSKQDAAQFAVDLGLVSPVTCRCGSEMKLKSAAAQKFSVQGVMWKCSRCKDKTGFFASSAWVVRALGAKELILLVYLWAQGTDYEQISHEVGVSYRHVCDLGTQLRECLWDYLQNYCDTRQLGGVDVVCEIDETEYGRKMKNQIGHKTDIKLDCWEAIQRDNGKIVLEPFEKPGRQPGTRRFRPARKDEVLPLVEKFVKKGSIVCSDRLRAYRDNLGEMGYQWAGVDHKNAEFLRHEPPTPPRAKKKCCRCPRK